MKAIELLQSALAISDHITMALIEDLRDAPLTEPTARGGNHPLWVLGHLAFVEASVPVVILGEPNALAHWGPLFGPGSSPTAEAGRYPSFDELLTTYRTLRARNLQLLAELGEEGLDRPTVTPPKGLEQVMTNAAQTFLILALHQMNHRGQVADARRTLAREPMFTPG